MFNYEKSFAKKSTKDTEKDENKDSPQVPKRGLGAIGFMLPQGKEISNHPLSKKY